MKSENVRILADVSSVEVFVNDGETVFSTRYYPQDYEIKNRSFGCQDCILGAVKAKMFPSGFSDGNIFVM